MTHKFKLTLVREDTGETSSLSGQLSSEDWLRLEDYVQYADELLDTKLVRDGMSASLRIEWAENSGPLILPHLPPSDDIAVFLHRLRPIFLKSERTSFSKVCDEILGQQVLTNPELRTLLGIQNDLYRGKMMPLKIQMQNGEVLNWDRLLSDWLNSYEYHRDREKRDRIARLHSRVPLEATKTQFITLLTHKTIAIRNIRSLARVVLGKKESINIIMNDINFILTNTAITEN